MINKRYAAGDLACKIIRERPVVEIMTAWLDQFLNDYGGGIPMASFFERVLTHLGHPRHAQLVADLKHLEQRRTAIRAHIREKGRLNPVNAVRIVELAEVECAIKDIEALLTGDNRYFGEGKE